MTCTVNPASGYAGNASLPSVEIRDGAGGIDAEGARDIEEFGDIESALAALEFRHEGLWPAELLGQSDLRQSRIATGLDEERAELHLLPAERRLRHRRSVQSYSGISQNGL